MNTYTIKLPDHSEVVINTASGNATFSHTFTEISDNLSAQVALRGAKILLSNLIKQGFIPSAEPGKQALSNTMDEIIDTFSNNNQNLQVDLPVLASEFEDIVVLNEATADATEDELARVRDFAQHTTPDYTIVIPDNPQVLWSGCGGYLWFPAAICIK